eukprot:comp18751_c0_seq1/m.20590 comp18751_c0_seq1/g.20590  ORF comp18751_c0_seq1/g.20590 comp18751_c0_seq1/m.20590 type:complete len:314 (-) comp18751_c0_seq1:657-1598(-)
MGKPRDLLASKKVTQFALAQNDIPVAGSKLACTAVACLAGAAFLRAKGNVKKCFDDNARVCELIREGVQFHHKWLLLDSSRKSDSSMASVDEITADIPDLGVVVKENYIAGMVGMDAGEGGFGVTLKKAIESILAPKHESQIWSNNAYVLTTRGYSTMIGKRGTKAVIFDSHQRDAHTGLATGPGETGRAVLIEFETKEDVLAYLYHLYAVSANQDALFCIQEIALSGDAKKKEKNEKTSRLLRHTKSESAVMSENKEKERMNRIKEGSLKGVKSRSSLRESLDSLRLSWKKKTVSIEDVRTPGSAAITVGVE